MEKNILFDLYGTLIDINTDEKSNTFWNDVKTNLFFDNKMTAIQLKNKYIRLCKKYSTIKEEIDILDVFDDLNDGDHLKAISCAVKFRELSTKYIRLYDGVKELLNELKKANYKLFVLSNAQNVFTIPELKKLGIIDSFNGFAISSDYGYKKPNKLFYKEAIKHFSIRSDAIMIGNDYECDVKPAIELSLKSIFIYSNLTPNKPDYVNKADFIGFDSDKIFERINELVISS